MQPGIRARWRIKPGQELGICTGTDGKNGALQERIFRRTPGGVENEIYTGLARQSRDAVNQSPQFRFDAKIQCAPLALMLSGDWNIDPSI